MPRNPPVIQPHVANRTIPIIGTVVVSIRNNFREREREREEKGVLMFPAGVVEYVYKKRLALSLKCQKLISRGVV